MRKEIFFFILIGIVSIIYAKAQQILIPSESLESLQAKNAFYKNIQNGTITFIDSLLVENPQITDSLINLAFLTKYDSLFNTKLYELIQALQTETDETKLAEIATNILPYKYDALIALEKINAHNQKIDYWRTLIQTLVLGYEVNNYKVEETYFQDFRIRPFLVDKKQICFSENSQQHTFPLRSLLLKYLVTGKNEQYQKEVHKTVLHALQTGKINFEFKQFAFSVIKNEVENEKDGFLSDYLTIIERNDDNSLFLINLINSHMGTKFYPTVFYELLNSKNEQIVLDVLEHSSNCWDERMAPLVQERVSNIFNVANEGSLKDEAAYVLMYDYGDTTAIYYLSHRMKNSTGKDRFIYLAWISDTYASVDLPNELDKVLQNFLKSDDTTLQQASIICYLNYKGEKVITRIIPYLNYDWGDITKRIQHKLTCYRNRKFVIQSLKDYMQKNDTKEIYTTVLKQLQD